MDIEGGALVQERNKSPIRRVKAAAAMKNGEAIHRTEGILNRMRPKESIALLSSRHTENRHTLKGCLHPFEV
jgi:hypothetical protein